MVSVISSALQRVRGQYSYKGHSRTQITFFSYFSYNLRKDGHSHLRLCGNYSLENGPSATWFCIDVGAIGQQELKNLVFGPIRTI